MESTILAASAGSATVPAFVPGKTNIVRGTYPELIAFLVLQMWPSHLGIPALLAVIFLSKKIQRHATFINLCITFEIAGLSHSLLVYAGKFIGPQPSPMLCLLQASLVYAYSPMTAVAAFALVLQMFLVIRASYYGKELPDRDHAIRIWVMIAAPYVAFLAAAVVTAFVGAGNPPSVSRDRRLFYCSVKSSPLTNSLAVFSTSFLIASIFVEVWLIVFLYKRWMIMRSKGLNMTDHLDLSMPLRVLAFAMYSTIALSLSLQSIKAPNSPIPDIAIATAPSSLVLVFGTQKDILNELCFWRKAPESPKPKTRSLEITVSKEQESTSFYNNTMDPQAMDAPLPMQSRGPSWPVRFQV